MARIKKYRPADQIERDNFIRRFCDNCIHKTCEIREQTKTLKIYDNAYPSAWRLYRRKPRCMAFESEYKDLTQLSVFDLCEMITVTAKSVACLTESQSTRLKKI